MTRVLVVLETGGAAGQDLVRGRLFEKHYRDAGIDVSFARRRAFGTSIFNSSSSRVVRWIASSQLGTWLGWKLSFASTRWYEPRIVRAAADADVVLFVKINSTRLVQEVRRASRARLVYDLADALWMPMHRRQHPDIETLLETVDAVTVDNPEAEAFARKHARAVFRWPSTSQVELFDEARPRHRPRPRRDDPAVVLGWLGSPGTLFHVHRIFQALERVARARPGVRLRLVGAPRSEAMVDRFEAMPCTVRPEYGPCEMIEELLEMDIALFPQYDVEEARAHGVLKALVYMAAELPVVATPCGQVPELIRDGENGVLAESERDWEAALLALIDEPDRRARIGAAALATARQFSISKNFEALLPALGLSCSRRA